MKYEELMENYAKGDYGAFCKLYEHYSPRIYSYFVSRVKNQEQAKDLTQEFFKKVHTYRAEYQQGRSLDAWFFSIAHNELVSFYRKQKTVEHSDVNTNDEVTDIDFKALDDEIEKLSSVEKQAVKMRYFEEQEIEHIAATIDKTQVNTRKIISRAIARLRKGLSHEA